MKELGYRLFSWIFYICRIFPVNTNKCFLVMTHDAGCEGNVGAVKEYLKKKDGKYVFIQLVRDDTNFHGKGRIKKLFRFFLYVPYQMATARYIFLDNIFLPMAFMKFKKKVSVVQLWHGTGTIKKFGQHSNVGRLKMLEERANSTITHLVVNSEYTKKLYQDVFQVSEDKVYIWGMPRTDILFNEIKKQEKLKGFYQEYPDLKDKEIILYAPTFRDDDIHKPELKIDVKRLLEQVDDKFVLGLRLHPHVASEVHYEGDEDKRVYDFTNYDNLNTLLFASSILITDYSSIVFEYCVLQKPMIFYAYDLEQFSDHGRGFYEEYESYVPGPVVRDMESMIEVINRQEFSLNKLGQFLEEAYAYTDGRAIERLVDSLFK